MSKSQQDREQWLRSDLEDAWRAVAAVQGPELGDTSAPLAERQAAFSERIGAFRRVMLPAEVPVVLPDEPEDLFGDLIRGDIT